MALHGTILVVGVIFLMWRKPGRGIRLRLRTLRVEPKALPNSNPAIFKSSGVRPQILNVHFMFNGHSFDAYEVLGLPAGSSMERIESSYQTMLAKPNREAREFLDAAVKALRDHLRAS
jgi:hypothetical protein